MNVSRLSRGRRWLAGDSSLALVIRNAGWLLLGKGFGAVLSLVYLAMTTRILGPQQFGQFTLVVGTAQAVAAFMSFQSWQLVIRFGPWLQLCAKNTAASRRLFAFCLALDIVTAIIGCADRGRRGDRVRRLFRVVARSGLGRAGAHHHHAAQRALDCTWHIAPVPTSSAKVQQPHP